MQSGEAAEQVVRIAFDGVEHALRIAGGGAQQIAAMLMAAFSNPGKTTKQPNLHGKERLEKMLKSGKELKFFEIQNKDLKEFCAAAKKYGITYCVMREKGKTGGMVEIVAMAEDAPRLSRILEKLESRALGESKPAEPAAPEQSTAELVEDLLAPAKEGQAQPENPTIARQMEQPAAKHSTPGKGSPSVTSSPTKSNGGATFSKPQKPSVKTALADSAARIAAKKQAPKPKSKQKAQVK
ncbi:MAG: DUF3801 domain-containing protein [Oscillospiraceae bacterium]|jgi:hypothetical protein|nr:DUF3801 domain-containing protein [Oscillospiraceae bacterium]